MTPTPQQTSTFDPGQLMGTVALILGAAFLFAAIAGARKRLR